MVELRRYKPKKVIEIQLPWRRVQQIHTPYHLRDTAFSVIGDHSQLIGVDAIGAPHNEVAAL